MSYSATPFVQPCSVFSLPIQDIEVLPSIDGVGDGIIIDCKKLTTQYLQQLRVCEVCDQPSTCYPVHMHSILLHLPVL